MKKSRDRAVVRTLWTVLIALTLTAAVLGASAGCDALSLRLRPTPTPTVPAEVPQELAKVWEVYRILSNDFVASDEIDPGKLSEGAIRGMLEALGDPYMAYLTAPEYQMETRDYSGRFEGIGAEVQVKDGQIVVVAPIEGGPAERAGIRPGDAILTVDDVSLQGKTLLEAVLLIRGPKGTTVSLLVQHPGEPAPVSISVGRDVIQIKSVRWRMLERDMAYLRISGFTEATPREVKDALQAIRAGGARGIVLDLRNNPGGLLDATVQVASQFLDKGLVLYEVDGHGKRTDWPVKSGGLARSIPLAVLVNRFSASGSEVLAGALQDHGRATIVGTKTFGKGSVNILKELSDGSGLYLTFARWYTPSGQRIEGQGIQPEVVVELPAASGEDVQLKKALELLESRVRLPVAAEG